MLYYAAPYGNDRFSGTEQEPFRTIAHAATILLPGDICLVRGGVYRETVRPAQSGTAEAPILFEAYPGEMVTVSGADEVTGWQHVEGAIWKAPLGVFTEQVFCGGAMLHEARWPKTGPDLLKQTYAITGEGTDVHHLVDPNLPGGDGYWEGAILWMQCTAKAGTARVTRHTGHTLEFDMMDLSKVGRMANPGHPLDLFDPKPGVRYFLSRGPLDSLGEGEWWLDQNTHELYVWLPGGADPNAHRIEAKRRDLAVDLSERNHIYLRGFTIHAATVTTDKGAHNTIDDCHFRYLSHVVEIQHTAEVWCEWDAGVFDTGVILGGAHNTLQNCTIVYSAGNGVTTPWYSRNNTVKNCLIHDVNYAGLDCAAYNGYGEGHLIYHNTMHRTGDSVIIHRFLRNSRIEYNDLFDAGYLNKDIGITYACDDGKNTIIAYNWVHDNHAGDDDESIPCGHGDGIYLDNASANFIVHHNVVWNINRAGIRINVPTCNTLLANNTVFSCYSDLESFHFNVDVTLRDCRYVNNLFVDGIHHIHDFEEIEIKPVMEHNHIGEPVRFVAADQGDFRLVPGSPGTNAGVVVPGVTRYYFMGAPDLGAYEQGAEYWTAGCTLTDRGLQAHGPIEPTVYRLPDTPKAEQMHVLGEESIRR